MSIEPTGQLKMDPASLYREETYTDRRMGTIRILTPVKTDGSMDTGRQRIYLGEAQMLTPAGTLPLVFEIEATSLGDAAEKFADAARVAIEHTLKELQELRREAASSIIVPDRMPPGLGGPGGRPGGGLIQAP
jgi:hypothetical protein